MILDNYRPEPLLDYNEYSIKVHLAKEYLNNMNAILSNIAVSALLKKDPGAGTDFQVAAWQLDVASRRAKNVAYLASRILVSLNPNFEFSKFHLWDYFDTFRGPLDNV